VISAGAEHWAGVLAEVEFACAAIGAVGDFERDESLPSVTSSRLLLCGGVESADSCAGLVGVVGTDPDSGAVPASAAEISSGLPEEAILTP